MQEFWKIIYKENGEQKEETVYTFEEFDKRIMEVWFTIDGLAEAVSGSI